MSRIANYESKIQNFLIADEEHLGMAGFDMARLAPFLRIPDQDDHGFRLNVTGDSGAT